MKLSPWSIQELAGVVNAWCRERGLQPVNGQASEELSVRTLRYYRTNGLLDAPETGGGRGYGKRHFLQLAAVRILQAQGLPLVRIQQLLFGRTDSDLQKIADSVEEGGTVDVHLPPLSSRETWTVNPVTDRIFLVARDGARVTESQLAVIRQLFDEQTKSLPR